MKKIWDFLYGDSISKSSVVRICRNIRLIATILIVLVQVELSYGINILNVIAATKLWNESIRNFLNSSIVGWMIFWLVYDVVISRVLFGCLYKIKKTDTYVPVLNTLDDMVDIVCSCVILVYAINRTIELQNGVCHSNVFITWISVIYFVLVLVFVMYNRNYANYMKEKKKNEFTNYYDMNGKRIPKDAYVCYEGKRHKVTLMTTGLLDKTEKEWYLESLDANCKPIKLEDAIQKKLILDESDK